VALAVLRNPTGTPVELHWSASPDAAGADLRLQVFDVAGRVVASIPITPGVEGVARWDGRDLGGRSVEPGLYFGRLRAAGYAATARIALIR
jgi:hypothetical protein